MNTLQNAQPIILFQSTPSQRGRQMDITQIIEELDFNPRPRKEGDLPLVYDDSLSYYISIHALAKRATAYINNVKLKIGNFNPRPRKEGDKP